MSKLVVVVDKDDAVRRMLVRCLEPLECSVQSFEDGRKALKFLERNASSVHLLIADQILPGLPGDQLVKQFQKLNPSAPALPLSGSDLQEWEGEIPVMSKPFSIPDFLQKVEMLLGVNT